MLLQPNRKNSGLVGGLLDGSLTLDPVKQEGMP